MRDDFGKATRDVLARRAAHICSNPACWALTVGPHSDVNKSLNTGHAAHIHAASKGGPRFEPNQTSAERKSIENGIWMCRNCGPRVDTDAIGFPAPMLRMWKRDHEAMIEEIGQQGYARTLQLLQAKQRTPEDARKVVALLDNHTALWVGFDAEFPDRVRQSLDRLRDNLTLRRSELPAGSSLDAPILGMIRAIQSFFQTLGKTDLTTLRCNSADPDWNHFSDALRNLRQDIFQRVGTLANDHSIPISDELARMGR